MQEFKEYSKISAHNHFGDNLSEKTTADSYDKEIIFNYKEALKKVNEAYKEKFDLLVFSNANVLLVSQYIALKKYAQQFEINILPGVEINIINKQTQKILHLVAIFNPKSNLYKISQKLEECIKNNQANEITIEQLVDIILNEKVILMPHGIKQTNYRRSSADNPEQLKEIIAMRNAIPIIIEDNKVYHKETLKARLKDKLNKEEFAWLDKSNNISCADRASFKQVDSPTYIWGNNTFDDLYFAVLMQGSRIKRKEDIIIKPNYISKIEITSKNKNSQVEESNIMCSHGLNSIIGQSGSGKTLLLNAIKRNLTDENLKVKISGISEYEEIYKDIDIKLYDNFNNLIDINSNWRVFEGDNLYNKILKVYSSDKNSIINELNLKVNDDKFREILGNFSKNISEYVNYQFTMIDIKEELKITLTNFASNLKFLEDNVALEKTNIDYFVDSKIENQMKSFVEKSTICNNDLNEINDLLNQLNNYAQKYKINDIKNEIHNISTSFNKKINLYMLKYNQMHLNLKINYEKQKKLYEIIKQYNSKLGKKLEEILIKKQENLNIIEKIKSLLVEYFKIKNKCFLKPLTTNELITSISLEKNDLSKLNIKNVNLRFDYSEYTKIFPNNIGSSANKVNLSKFQEEKILDLGNYASIIRFLQIFINEKYKKPIELDITYTNYIECQIDLKNSSNKFENIETMSAGELSKTYISNMLENQIKNGGANLIILFDQPDNSLEKKFILEELASKIDKLRNKFQVFVTTHEPLLVVNADSNNIIKAENNKIAINRNNHIVYENLSFVGFANTKDKMIETIASLVDGSYDAVKERNKIYGGMLNENISD